MSENSNNFEEKISAILSNPEAMASIINIAKGLGLQNNTATDKENDTAQKSIIDTEAKEISAVPVVSKPNSIEDKTAKSIALLCAIKPFLDNERAERIDKITQIMKILNITGLIK